MKTRFEGGGWGGSGVKIFSTRITMQSAEDTQLRINDVNQEEKRKVKFK